jgi:hypothetical protein
MSFTPDNVFIIGVGGTGGFLAPPLTRLVAYHPSTENTKVVFIDGDEYEDRNMTRQIVGPAQVGLNKARAMVDFCAYQGLTNVECVEDFISMESFAPMINKSKCPLVVCAVDNDATRHDIINTLISFCRTKDFLFITPGNSDGVEVVRGQTLWFGRVDGNNIGLNPALVYSNIENPEDSIPKKGSCALLAPSRPQLIAANVMSAAITLSVIQNILDDTAVANHSGMFFDIRKLSTTVS